MCVSSCRCCVLVPVVHPVAIISAVFCVICSLVMLVSDASGHHVLETYSSMVLVMALYVVSIVLLCYGDVVCVGREFCWCLWCWSVRCVYVKNCVLNDAALWNTSFKLALC